MASMRPYLAMGTRNEGGVSRRCLTLCWANRLWTFKLWQVTR
jgi:hypothetical protein